jgi:hypothetical protein
MVVLPTKVVLTQIGDDVTVGTGIDSLLSQTIIASLGEFVKISQYVTVCDQLSIFIRSHTKVSSQVIFFIYFYIFSIATVYIYHFMMFNEGELRKSAKQGD